MQVVQAGPHRLLQLELDPQILADLAKQAGFDCKLAEGKRALSLELNAPRRPGALLLFDAADPGNLGWFSRCQFYVDGQTGAVLQTPMSIANIKDRSGEVQPDAVRLQIAKELPLNFRLPAKSPVNEQTIYALFLSFLNALLSTGVGVCGGPIVKPLAGRTEHPGVRN
jgi:hypothetical protein